MAFKDIYDVYVIPIVKEYFGGLKFRGPIILSGVNQNTSWISKALYLNILCSQKSFKVYFSQLRHWSRFKIRFKAYNNICP
jgi:hypothetical protein